MPGRRLAFPVRSFPRLFTSAWNRQTKFILTPIAKHGDHPIQLRRVDDPNLSGKIEVFTDPENHVITFLDNGKGMDKRDIEELLSTIGSTGTGTIKEELARKNIAIETISQFGIGLLSAFVVAERIDVYTRKAGDGNGWR